MVRVPTTHLSRISSVLFDSLYFQNAMKLEAEGCHSCMRANAALQHQRSTCAPTIASTSRCVWRSAWENHRARVLQRLLVANGRGRFRALFLDDGLAATTLLLQEKERAAWRDK